MALRPIPEDPETEKSLLATICAQGSEHIAALCLPHLCPDDFLTPAHRLIFEAAAPIIREGREVALVVLSDAMSNLGTLSRAGGISSLTDVLEAQEVGNPLALVDILNRYRHRRELLRLAFSLNTMAHDALGDPAEAIHSAQSELARISRDGQKDPGESWVETLNIMSSFEKFSRPGLDRGGYWGIPSLDRFCPIPAGEYVTIGARPGTGKTALLTQVAIESAKKGIKTLVISLELILESMRARLVSYIAKVPVSNLKRGEYQAEHVAMVGNSGGILSAGRLQCPSAGTPWNKLESLIRHEVDRYGIQLVLLDQFDKIGRSQVVRGSSEAYAFGAVSTGIMALTQELGIGFVLLCQLKGDAEGREPNLSDHADSDRPGKDAAVVIHLWKNKDGKLKCKLQKNRDGAGVGRKWNLDLDGSSQKFTEVEDLPTVADYPRSSESVYDPYN